MTRLEYLGGREAVIAGILEEFQGLSARPHGSGQEEAESRYLVERLEGLGLSPVRDRAGNVMADVPATPGREESPLLILQGHMDMVCTVRPGSGFDPRRDPPRVVVRDGFVRTDGNSTLGADNNLGNAVVLYLLAQGVEHGPLRLLFTVSEEVGLKGAAQVDPSWLAGAYGLLNTDGFHFGRAIAGSAGGRRETYVRTLERRAAAGTEGWHIALTGGTGGHSGDDIHRGRLNAVQTLASFLQDRAADWEVAEFSGGSAHNAIPASAQAVLVLPAGQEGLLQDRVAALRAEITRRYGESDPHARVEVEPVPCPEQVWSDETVRAVCGLAAGLFHGVYAMHPAFPNVVGASANVAAVQLRGEEAAVLAFIRCARREEEAILFPMHDAAVAQAGFALREVSYYPGWPGDPQSRLIQVLCQSYQEAVGRKMEVTAVHVGLEPSVLGEKAPGMVMVSAGPDILDAHSVDERAPLDTLPDYATTLAGVLAGN